MSHYLESYLKLHNYQFGFRKYTSCLSAITVPKETIVTYQEHKSKLHCAMIDMSKAFDKINIGLLVKKLHNTDLPRAVVNIIEYMLSNTDVYV